VGGAPIDMSGDPRALLAQLRDQFLDGLDERLQRLEHGLLRLADATDWEETFNAVYRETHSIKGLGGTHGLHLLSTVAHALENLLETLAPPVPSPHLDRLLAYLDLMRTCARQAREGSDEAPIRAALEALQEDRPQALLLEPSQALAGMTTRILTDHGFQVSRHEDGLEALKALVFRPYRLLVCAGHARTLGGLAVIAALRAQDGPNRRIQALLLTADGPGHFDLPGRVRLIPRGPNLPRDMERALAQWGGRAQVPAG